MRLPLDTAPPPNGRTSVQTERLNQPLDHVFVLLEGKRPPSPDFMTSLCAHVMPDVFEDDPSITGTNARRFRGDGQNLAMAFVVEANDAYLTPEYDLRVYPGKEAGRGPRWVIVKIFEARPKYVDPDGA
ncbi:MAG: hypothetical protein GEV12_20755 [Micromonosporaceae bacterium]|nr:hypothetical protein [Micromonosporaceae bacterium]